MEINIDIVEGSSAINQLITRLKSIPNIDEQYVDNLIFFIRKYQKAIHVNSYDSDGIKQVYQILQYYYKDIPLILETEFDIILPWDSKNMNAVKFATSYVNFLSLQVSEKDIPDVKLSSVSLLTDEEYIKKYPHNRLTQYALGSQYYINALRTEENIFRTHKCIICTGSFQEIDRLRSMLIKQNIPCGNLNMDVLCISPDNNTEYLYRLILGGKYYSTMKELSIPMEQ